MMTVNVEVSLYSFSCSSPWSGWPHIEFNILSMVTCDIKRPFALFLCGVYVASGAYGHARSCATGIHGHYRC